MKTALASLCLLLLSTASVRAEPLTADQIVARLIAFDPFGFSGAAISARLKLTDKGGSTSELAFAGKSLQYAPPLSKGLIRFSAPADLAGAAFLQVQKSDGDDERFLFLPELKRSRRIAGSLRSSAFMGTDFTFADLDRRDLRDSRATLKGKETIGKWPCHVVDVVPRSSDSDYSHVEIWVREDNFLPLRLKMYDRKNAHTKTLEALETKRVDGSWFISKARMTNHPEKHTTELLLEKIAVKNSFSEAEFSVRALEKP
jgi:hypothetical protein